MVHDPLADRRAAQAEYGLDAGAAGPLRQLDALVLAVPHRAYLELGAAGICACSAPGGIVIDVKSALDPAAPARRPDLLEPVSR